MSLSKEEDTTKFIKTIQPEFSIENAVKQLTPSVNQIAPKVSDTIESTAHSWTEKHSLFHNALNVFDTTKSGFGKDQLET